MKKHSQKIVEFVETDPVIQEGIESIPEKHRRTFKLRYGLEDGFERTPEQVAQDVGCHESEVELSIARSIILIRKSIFERLINVLRGKEVESAESIRDRKMIQDQFAFQFSLAVQNLKESGVMSEKDAQDIWNGLNTDEQSVIFLKYVQGCTYKRIHEILKRTPTTISHIFIKLKLLLQSDENIRAMINFGVVKDPAVKEEQITSDENTVSGQFAASSVEESV